ncbi:tRNA (guanine(26)-N(2))-dimethyltransferase [Procambarus clarkii]|uniref:tRNA (guanine(26)-N(2))-dimethyltransferase n=1 Tax=Procambarus clarkii TaxID=6728 RepID=UPI001E6741F2|nr:probable tRNA (guanine(26)-N(2))-dimethyltransferase [Procambarus clarkii]
MQVPKLIRLRSLIKQLISIKFPRKMATRESLEAGSSVVSETEATEEVSFVIDKRPFTSVSEGKAEVLFPSSHDVFYNPVQEFNRDLSVAVLRIFAAEFKKLEREKKYQAELKEKKLAQKKSDSETSLETPNAENDPSDDKELANKIVVPVCEDEKTSILPPGIKDEDGIRILEGLAASGLRSIRYAKEVGGVKEIIANDISNQALECMKTNIDHNKVGDIVIPSHNDASMVMYQNRELSRRFHAIDLDPYGSPHTFLDGAVQSIADGGILLVTCTDMAVLCGNSPETCYSKYGALSIKSKACHEIALRIVLQCIESHANRYGRYIVPLLSMSADFYVRVVVKVFTSRVKCKETFSKVSWLYQCVGCETRTLQPLGRIVINGKSVKYQLSSGPPVAEACSHCSHRHLVAGPIWSAPIHDKDFLKSLKESLVEEDFSTFRRMYGILTMMEEELQDIPLYYVLDKLSNIAGINPCKMVQFRSALLNAGYRVSMSHTDQASIKTDAPPQVVWDIVRAWEKLRPANRAKMPDDRAGKRILEKEILTKISFDLHPEAKPESKKQDLLRFQVKPEKNWGPKAKAKTSLFNGDQEEKRSRNQGKKRRCQNGDKPLPNKMTKSGNNQISDS